jgi:hypothetical protein
MFGAHYRPMSAHMNKLRESANFGLAAKRLTSIGTGTFRRSVHVCGLMVIPSFIAACPLCHTPTGQQVRAGIFDGWFATRLLVTAAPFPVLAGIVAAIYMAKPKLRRDDQ